MLAKKLIYIHTSFAEDNSSLRIMDNELYFLECMNKLNLTDKELEVMEAIDGISFVRGTYIETKFGATHISNISTGLKTYLNAMYIQKNHIDASISLIEAGPNVLDYIFRDIDTRNLYVMLNHNDVNVIDSPFRFNIDGVEVEGVPNLLCSLRGGARKHD